MSFAKDTNFTDRLKSSAEAKKALLAKFKPKPAVQDPDFENRHAAREAELETLRQRRREEKEAARLAAEEARAAAVAAVAEAEMTELEAKRAERKARKAQAKAEARSKREMKRTGR